MGEEEIIYGKEMICKAHLTFWVIVLVAVYSVPLRGQKTKNRRDDPRYWLEEENVLDGLR